MRVRRLKEEELTCQRQLPCGKIRMKIQKEENKAGELIGCQHL